ncbi:MAG: hypothetical protein JO038_07205 [Alphaproteobacteria bacterium]|nr:hypothetical protein [Alphaproteobacteria bacterium]
MPPDGSGAGPPPEKRERRTGASRATLSKNQPQPHSDTTAAPAEQSPLSDADVKAERARRRKIARQLRSGRPFVVHGETDPDTGEVRYTILHVSPYLLATMHARGKR